MKKDDLVTYLLIGGGLYAAYWYVNNYGPNGASIVNGVKVQPTWWDTWFGSSPTTSTGTTGTTGTTGSTGSTGGSTATVVNSGTSITPTTFSQKLVAAANGQTSLNGDNWSYFWAQLTGTALTPAQFLQAFPNVTVSDRGPNMSADQFVAALSAVGIMPPAGIGDIVGAGGQTQTVFAGGGFRQPSGWGGSRGRVN